MSLIVSIKDLSYRINENIIFEQMSLDIKEGTFLSILGPNGCGKSTLARMLVGLVPSFDKIKYRDLIVNQANIRSIRSEVGVIFSNLDNSFLGNTVIEDMAYTLENLGLPKQEIRARLDEVYTLLGIENLLDLDPTLLSGGEKFLVALASVLVLKPRMIIIDEALAMLDSYQKTRIFKILKSLQKSGMTIIMITHDLETIVYSDSVVAIIDKKMTPIYKPLKFFADEDLMRKLSLDIPFMVDLSLKLKLYGLVDDIILDKKKMVGVLWK